MAEVNAEKIMMEIRERIAAEHGTEFPVETAAGKAPSLSESIARMEKARIIPNAGDLRGGPLTRFGKKVVRRLTRFFVAPVAEDATLFNEAALDAVRALTARVKELEEELNRK